MPKVYLIIRFVASLAASSILTAATIHSMAEPETFTLPPEDLSALVAPNPLPPDSHPLLDTAIFEDPDSDKEYVPEPYTLIMIGSGLVAIGLVRRRGR